MTTPLADLYSDNTIDEVRLVNLAIIDELTHALGKHGRDHTPLNPAMDQRDRFVILMEEVGEVANAMTYDEHDHDRLIDELIQVAAMAVASVVGLRRE